MPGPITSPLSSSLSAIVADTLRRGGDYTSSPSIRRPSFKRLKRSMLDPNATPRKRHSIASGEMDFSTPGTGVGEDGSGTGGRVRSLSATLHDLFGPASAKRKSGVESAPENEGNGNDER